MNLVGTLRRSWLVSCLLVLTAAQLIAAARVAPGFVCMDEVTYYLMVKNVVERGSLHIWNNYVDFPSRELSAPQIAIVGDHLTAQYPFLYPLMAAPFYAVFGYRGLFFVNALAFGACVYLTYLIARRFLPSKAAAGGAVALLVGCTYFGEYGVATWPHLVALAFCLGSFLATCVAIDRDSTPAAEPSSRVPWPSLVAGLLGGLAIGVRLDALFLAASLTVPFLLASPVRWRDLLSFAAGLAPPLALMARINFLRFGTPSPFSYGPKPVTNYDAGVTSYLPLAALLLAALVLLWLWTRPWVPAWARSPAALLAPMGTLVAVVVAVPMFRVLGRDLVEGLECLVFDLGRFPPERAAPGELASGFIYFHGVPKKALLQSCPFFVAALFPLGEALANPRRHRDLWLLFLIPAVYVGVYASKSWHGGAGTNLRYFLPALPFLCILTVRALTRLLSSRRGSFPVLAALLGLAVGLGAFTLAMRAVNPDGPWTLARAHLAAPLYLAIAGTTALFLAHSQPRAVLLGVGVLFTGFAWGSGATYWTDARTSAAVRRETYETSLQMAAAIPDRSLVFYSAQFMLAMAPHSRHEVSFAIPRGDDFETMGALAGHHLKRGDHVFGLLRPVDWTLAVRHGQLEGLRVSPITLIQRPTDSLNFLLAEILPVEGGDGVAPSP